MKLLQQDNIGSHYRSAIYQLMDKELGCDFCFGDKVDDIKKMDYSLLSHKVIETPNKRLGGGFYYQKGVISLLWKDYDTYILVGETRCVSTWLFCILARLFCPKKRVFFWSHGWYGKESIIEKLIKKILFRLPNSGSFLYGNYARKLMIKEGFNPDKLYVIHNSLDYDAQLPIRQQLKPKPIYKEHFVNDNYNIVFIGRLTKVKRFDLLIDAVSILKQNGTHINVTFIGDGVEREHMEQIVAEKDIKEQIWFYGACYDENKLGNLIYNADLCVSPGNIGLTAMHVMMFGCPAITNNDFCHQMPEFEAIREGVTGAFFEAGNSASLADTINRWFAIHSGDREVVRKSCYNEIDEQWTPLFQIEILKKVLL